MNYYIQGNKDKADQIKAAFEKLGIDTSANSNYGISNLFYFSHNGEVAVTQNRSIINIIKTNPDYKELELPVEPKFKVGDEIIWNEPKGSSHTEPVKVIQLIDKDQLYMVDMSNGVGYVAYDMQDYYELIPKPHYDIKNFHAGMPILVRCSDDVNWNYVVFSHYNKDAAFPFRACGTGFKQCIPFEGNEHLLGTTDPCCEEYINW